MREIILIAILLVILIIISFVILLNLYSMKEDIDIKNTLIKSYISNCFCNQRYHIERLERMIDILMEEDKNVDE